MNRKKTIFITGGGTGGHIYPAVAIYNALKEDAVELFYIGNKKKLEYEICKKQGFNFLPVNVDAMPRKIGFGFIFWALKTFFASFGTLFYFLKYKPDIVFATGGYVSAPALICALFTKTPYMLHDCDAYPGIVSRIFSKYAKKVSIAFESAKELIKNKNVEFNGNPIRESFALKSKSDARFELNLPQNVFVILIMGGSQGAKTINEASLTVIENLKNRSDIKIIVQTGKKHYEDYLKSAGEIPLNTIVKSYFEDMTLPLIASDLVVSRAGSLSISEICASNSSSILIPYPYAAKDHQRLNAKKLQELGASLYIEDTECTGEKLYDTIKELLNDKDKIALMTQKAAKNAKLNATKDIKQQLLELTK